MLDVVEINGIYDRYSDPVGIHVRKITWTYNVVGFIPITEVVPKYTTLNAA